MNSDILSAIGLGWLDPAICLIVTLVLILLLFILLIVQGSRIKKLGKRLDDLTTGEDGRSLEKEIKDLFTIYDEMSETAKAGDRKLTRISRQIKSCAQKIGLIRYDAFSQMGGKLSYALAILDEDDNGLIINSVRSTDGCYSYIKEIKEGKCETDLGAEEQKALQRAVAGFNEDEI